MTQAEKDDFKSAVENLIGFIEGESVYIDIQYIYIQEIAKKTSSK